MPLDLGSGVILEATSVGSGTGNYDSFLRVQSNGEEDGYNTDINGQLDNKDGIWTHSILLSGMAIVTVDGVDYYEIRLDLNEIQSGDSPNITLTELQLFYGAAAGAGADFSGLTQVFDLAGSQLLVDTNSGSGTDDYRFLVPVSLFPDPSQYFTLYASFSGADDGFEEFRVQTTEFVPQPDIGINKQTNGTDDVCPTILVGANVTWTYTVTNDGNIPIANVVLTDDNGTPLDTSDDFNPVYVSGDTNGNDILDITETWLYSYSAPAGIGEYMNIGSVGGTWAYGEGSGSLSDFEEDCYFGANPDLEIVKLTNGTEDLCPVLSVGEDVTWTYLVTNTGNVVLDVVVVDDNGTPGDTSDDFIPDQILSGGFNAGDTDLDGIFDPGEIWQYIATGTVVEGHYENTATASADFTDDFDNSTTATSSDSDCYVGVDGCVRTPGFWQNPRNGGQFWDGVQGNERHGGEDGFPPGELLYAVDSNNDGFINALAGDGINDGKPLDSKGLLIGDYNRDGLSAGEDTFFISYDDARALINANNRMMDDGVVKIGRDVIATWLNYLAGSAIGDESDLGSPRHFIDDAIDFLQIFGDSDNSNPGGYSDTGDTFDIFVMDHKRIGTSTDFWTGDFPGGDHSGSEIHSALDGFNNTGTINGVAYSASCDNPQYVEMLRGYAIDSVITLM